MVTCVTSCGCEVEMCQTEQIANTHLSCQFLQKLIWRLLLGSWRIFRSKFEADWSSARGDQPFLLFGPENLQLFPQLIISDIIEGN